MVLSKPELTTPIGLIQGVERRTPQDEGAPCDRWRAGFPVLPGKAWGTVVRRKNGYWADSVTEKAGLNPTPRTTPSLLSMTMRLPAMTVA